eukprot:2106600-Prorocentrum_lima.AAC.1
MGALDFPAAGVQPVLNIFDSVPNVSSQHLEAAFNSTWSHLERRHGRSAQCDARGVAAPVKF